MFTFDYVKFIVQFSTGKITPKFRLSAQPLLAISLDPKSNMLTFPSSKRVLNLYTTPAQKVNTAAAKTPDSWHIEGSQGDHWEDPSPIWLGGIDPISSFYSLSSQPDWGS